MTSVGQKDFVPNGHERSMFVQRPSSGRCQDISHLLTKIFRDDFTKDAIDQDTVRNLTTSKSGKTGYHDQYVEKLHQIQKQWENRMEDANVIEKHMQEAYKSARENEAIREKKSSAECASFKELGLPSVQSHLDSHLNSTLLRRFNLIVPQDFIEQEKKAPYETKDERSPQYARPTTSSMQRYRKTPVEDNYYPGETEQGEHVKESKSSGAEVLKINHSESDGAAQAVCEENGAERIEKKNIWRKLMKPSQRQVEREDLAKLQQKADYLKNPRFLPPKSIRESQSMKRITNGDLSQATMTKTCSAGDVFEASPSPIVFTDYEAGSEYEITLTLKNITSSSRQLRVLPPSTSYFVVSHGKFPTTDGLVAPGMSCQYVIKFLPDSLADFDDVLKVEAKFSESHVIQLQGRRDPPVLSLPDTFASGHCLVGGTKTIQVPCLNSGGEGKFVLVPKQNCKPSSFQEHYDAGGVVSVGPFALQPNSFHLRPNESIDLMLSFFPDAVKKFQESLVMLCDNCQIKEFKIEGFGETAGVELVSVEDGLSDYEAGESKDAHASYLVKFFDQIPGTQKVKEMKIRNVTSVDLEYYWQIDRPVYAGKRQHIPLESGDQREAQFFAFEVQPSSGKLAPQAATAFGLSFQPMQLTSYRNVAKLVLLKVPCTDEGQGPDMTDLTTIQIELKGKTKTFEVAIHPQLITLDGSVEINIPHHLEFTIFNNSSSPCRTTWENIDDEDCLIQMENNEIEVGPNSQRPCYVTCVGKRPGLARKTIFGRIPHMSLPAYCHFELHFTGPVVRFVDRLLNFGLVRHMNNQKRLVELKNFSSIDAHWKLNNTDMDLISIEPASGVIESNSTQVIMVHLRADTPCILNEIIEISVNSGESCFLEARAIIERPEAVLLESRIRIEECFANIPVSTAVTLQNLTLFSVDYKWTQVFGKDSDQCDIQFSKAEGTLKPREKLETELILCVKSPGKIDELIAVCEVEGMLCPLMLSIVANCSGLKVEFSTPDVSGLLPSHMTNPELKLEFGYDVPISLNPKAVIVMKNVSAISTSFSIHVENFKGGRLPTPPEKKRTGKQTTKVRSLPLLSNTDAKADINNRLTDKAFRDLCEAALSDGKGVAFLPNPSHGQLGPFEQIIIEVTAYIDMWGEYNDKLVCQIEGQNPVEIPIHLECSGCPLKFQFSKDPNPVLRFGSHISGGDTHSRTVKINNPSPCDIRLDWQCYSSENDDMQLIDLLVMFGNPFPVLDANGHEVESEEDLREPLVKVKLNPHQGKMSKRPFAVEPKQMIIPAKTSTQATARFIPTENIRETMDVQGYALGFMSLANQDKFFQESQTLRCDGIDVPPFHLNFTGSIKPAKVSVETESENGFVFETVASNLLQQCKDSSYKVIDECISSRRYVLVNNSGTPLRFSVVLEEPFELLCIDDKDATKQRNGELSLNQGGNVQIKVGLKLSPLLLASLAKSSRKEVSSAAEREDSHTGLQQRIAFECPMLLVFPNGTEQTYSLLGLIHLPLLQLSTGALDFKTCLVEQERELHVVIKNTGKSDCYWSAVMDKDYPEASRSAFKVTPMTGYLEGENQYGCRNSETIKVKFTARRNVDYECRLFISGVLEEEPLVLQLAGKGSFDQISEQIVNILT